VTPDERREVISLRDHLEQRLDDMHKDLHEQLDRQDGRLRTIEDRQRLQVTWPALGAILTSVAAAAAFLFSILDRIS
jgi:type VI protein secretion system component VasF